MDMEDRMIVPPQGQIQEAHKADTLEAKTHEEITEAML
jgi:hypothetical protein